MVPNNANKSIKELLLMREVMLELKITYSKFGCYVMSTHDHDEKEKEERKKCTLLVPNHWSRFKFF